jgi:hypothetical protein
MVMPMGLTNTPATFQDMIHHILKDLLDKVIIVYINDILMYAQTEEKHDIFVKKVLTMLAKNKFVISLEICI